MAITAIAAVASMGAVAAEVVAVETLVTIATVVSVVGAVTKNPVLSKIGAGMGLAGLGAGLVGVGSEAGTGAALANTGEGTLTVPTEFGKSAADAYESADLGSLSADSFSTGGAAVEPAASSTAAGTAGATADVVPQPAGINVDGVAKTTVDAIPPAGSDTTGAASDALSTPNATTNANLNVDAPNAPTAPQTKDINTKPLDKSNGFLDFIDKHDKLINGIATVGGAMLSNVGKQYEADRQYDLQKQKLDAEQNNLAIQRANANAQPTIGMAINPNANIWPTTARQYSGIIAGKRG